MGMIKFNGASSKDFGVEVETFPNYVAPQKEYEAIHIPGRNGDLLIDSGTYSNVEKRYKVNMVKEPPATEVSGPIANFKSNTALPLSELKTNINPVQDLHGYSKPWIGGAGKNKYCDIFSKYTQPNDYRVFPITLMQGQTYKLWASLKGSAVSGCTIGLIKDGTQYSNFVGFAILINSSGYINTVPSFTVDETFTNPKLVIYASTETAFNSIFQNYNVQLEQGSQATSWEPYENICPISGFSALTVTRTGKNLFNPSDVVEGYTSNTDGGVKQANTHNHSSGLIKVVGGEKYIITTSQVGGQWGAWYDASNNFISGFSGYDNPITAPNNAVYCRFTVEYNDNNPSYASNVMFEKGETRSTFEPYNGSKYQSYFSGLANGTYGVVDLGTLDWINEDSDVLGLARVGHTQVIPLGAKYLQTPICTNFLGVLSKAYTLFDYGEIGFSNSVNRPFIRARSTEFVGKTDAEIKALMSGVYLIYELETQTTPTITQFEIDDLISKFDADLCVVVFDSNKNLYKTTTETQYATLKDGIYTLTSLPSSGYSFRMDAVMLKAGNYILNGGVDYNYRCFIQIGSDIYATTGNDVAFTLAEDQEISVIGVIMPQAVIGWQLKPMIRLASEPDSSFETYGGLRHVYGGSLNVTTGLLTIDKVIIKNIVNYYKDFFTGTYSTCYRITLPALSTNILYSQKHGAISNCKNEESAYWGGNHTAEANSANNIFAINPLGEILAIYDADTSLTKTAFESKYADFEAVFPLATPIEIQLTAEDIKTFIGDNNIFSDTGDVDIKTNELATTYSGKMELIANWLNSASGYARLEDSYDPDYYRLAYFNQALDIENIYDEAGRVELSFICKPQKFYKSGEDPVVFTSAGKIQNRTQHAALPLLKVKTDNTDGTVSIGNSSFGISAGSGTDIIIDCELQNAYYGIENKNNYIVLNDGDFPRIEPGTQVVSFTGGVQSVEVIPRWWTV